MVIWHNQQMTETDQKKIVTFSHLNACDLDSWTMWHTFCMLLYKIQWIIESQWKLSSWELHEQKNDWCLKFADIFIKFTLNEWSWFLAIVSNATAFIFLFNWQRTTLILKDFHYTEHESNYVEYDTQIIPFWMGENILVFVVKKFSMQKMMSFKRHL